jgi:hypothetical protein
VSVLEGMPYIKLTSLLFLDSFMNPDQAAIIQCMSSVGKENSFMEEEKTADKQW